MMTTQTKRKHSKTFNTKELYDLFFNKSYDTKLCEFCDDIDDDNRKESFDSIRQWLNVNKDDDDRLNAAITYHGNLNLTPLHLIMFRKPPLDIIQIFNKYAPEVLKMKDIHGRLPIHLACAYGGSLDLIQALINTSPDTIKVEENDGWLPLHYACIKNSSLDLLNLLIDSYPEGVDHKDKDGRIPLDILKENHYAEKMDNNGMLPLHHACLKGYSDHFIHFFIRAYPERITIKDNNGNTPSDYYRSKGSELSNKIIKLLQTTNKRTSKIPVVSPAPQMTNDKELKKKNPEMDTMKVELKADINEVKADVNQVLVELNAFKASVQSDITEIKSMLRQFGAV